MDPKVGRSGSRARRTVAVAVIVWVAVATACSSSTGSGPGDGQPGSSPGGTAVEATSPRPVDESTPPEPEPISVRALPLPETAPSDSPGSCPDRNGCISAADTGIVEGPGATWDGHHVLLTVELAGAAEGSTATGTQVIAIATDDSTYANGEAWRCITCGVPDANKAGMSEGLDHPQAFHDGTRVLAGTNVIDCGDHPVTSDECTPDDVHVYPIWWQTTADGSGKGGSMRELRLHPDDVHLGWSHIILEPQLAEPAFLGRLQFNPSPQTGTPLVPRYELSNVTALQSTDPTMSGTFISVDPADPSKLSFDEPAGVIGEFRGWTSDGASALGFGLEDSANFDVYATDLQTGQSRRLSRNPAYVDPIKASPDDDWNVIMDSRVDDRMMFVAGLPGVPPLTDQVIGVPFVVSSMRNNQNRRFFEPYLLDRFGDRGDYGGQQVNGCGPDDDPTPGSGSICDPLWNGRADPAWSPDGTAVIFWQALVTDPSCGGANPLACPTSTEPGGRRTRLMIAELTSRAPVEPEEVAPIDDEVPWGIPYRPGDPFPMRGHLPGGTYTLAGKRSGSADVIVVEDDQKTSVVSVEVTYHDYSNDGATVLNGTERADAVGEDVTWHTALEVSGEHTGTKRTSEPEGFTMPASLSALGSSSFDATGTMTTTLDGHTYEQPRNGT